jgi:hypothetical protein
MSEVWNCWEHGNIRPDLRERSEALGDYVPECVSLIPGLSRSAVLNEHHAAIDSPIAQQYSITASKFLRSILIVGIS